MKSLRSYLDDKSYIGEGFFRNVGAMWDPEPWLKASGLFYDPSRWEKDDNGIVHVNPGSRGGYLFLDIRNKDEWNDLFPDGGLPPYIRLEGKWGTISISCLAGASGSIKTLIGFPEDIVKLAFSNLISVDFKDSPIKSVDNLSMMDTNVWNPDSFPRVRYIEMISNRYSSCIETLKWGISAWKEMKRCDMISMTMDHPGKGEMEGAEKVAEWFKKGHRCGGTVTRSNPSQSRRSIICSFA